MTFVFSFLFLNSKAVVIEALLWIFMCEVSIGVSLKWYFICCKPNSLVQTIGVTLAPRLARADATLMAFPPRISVWGMPSMLPPFRLATSAINPENSEAFQFKLMSLSRKKSGKTTTLHSIGFFRSRKFFSSFLHSAMDIERLL